MFTRAVELTSKPGKSKELAKAINERAVPILKKQQGFVDEIVLGRGTRSRFGSEFLEQTRRC